MYRLQLGLGPEDVSLLERCPHFRGWHRRRNKVVSGGAQLCGEIVNNINTYAMKKYLPKNTSNFKKKCFSPVINLHVLV